MNVSTIGGSKGVGTVVQYDDHLVRLMLDSGVLAPCCRHEVSVLRDQSVADHLVLRRLDEMTDDADEARLP